MGKGAGVSTDPGFGQVGHDGKRSKSVRRKSGWLGTLLLAGDGGRPVNSQVIKVIGTNKVDWQLLPSPVRWPRGPGVSQVSISQKDAFSNLQPERGSPWPARCPCSIGEQRPEVTHEMRDTATPSTKVPASGRGSFYIEAPITANPTVLGNRPAFTWRLCLPHAGRAWGKFNTLSKPQVTHPQSQIRAQLAR